LGPVRRAFAPARPFASGPKRTGSRRAPRTPRRAPRRRPRN